MCICNREMRHRQLYDKKTHDALYQNESHFVHSNLMSDNSFSIVLK